MQQTNEEISIHDTTNIYDECLIIIEDKKTLNHENLSNKWNNFKTKFPQLYEMLIQNENIDLNLLKLLCDTANKQNKLTLKEKRLENDFEIGNQLANTFIYDKFNKPTESQEQYIRDTIRTKILNGHNFTAKK